MPGIVQGDVRAGVMPKFLCELFQQTREYAGRLDEYADATNDAGLIVFASRRQWVLKPKLAISAMISLRNFWISMSGGVDAFVFYDWTESTPYANYDATGTDPNGRFLVRFEGKWEQANSFSQIGTASITLVELIEAGTGVGQLDYSTSNGFPQFAF